VDLLAKMNYGGRSAGQVKSLSPHPSDGSIDEDADDGDGGEFDEMAQTQWVPKLRNEKLERAPLKSNLPISALNRTLLM